MTKSPWCGTIKYHTKEVFVMSDGFKAFSVVSLILGVILILVSFFSLNSLTLVGGISGIVLSISLGIASGVVKIMEDTRDTLKRIEKLLDKENTQE